MEEITILITDDHTLVRETWSMILNNDPRFSVVGECSTGEEALELAKRLQPDVIIMDINLPGISGIETTHLLRKYAPGSKILGVSLHTQPSYAKKMMQNGAMGYVTKNSTREEMFQAILDVNSGRKYICKEIKNNLSEQMLTGGDRPIGTDSLTERKLEVIKYIKKGYSSREIADEMNIAVKTIEVHRYNILKKLDLKNTAALVEYVNRNLL